MIFQQSSVFEDVIRAVAANFRLKDIFIEKDYWVLNNLKKKLGYDPLE